MILTHINANHMYFHFNLTQLMENLVHMIGSDATIGPQDTPQAPDLGEDTCPVYSNTKKCIINKSTKYINLSIFTNNNLKKTKQSTSTLTN